MMNNGMAYGDHLMGWGGFFFGPLVMIGFVSLIILAVVVVVKWMIRGDNRHQNPPRH